MKNIPATEHPIFPTDPDDPTKVIDGRILVVPGYKPEQGKPNDPVAPAKNPSQNVNVPYIKESTQPPAPDNPTPQPTPTPEPPKTPEKDNTNLMFQRHVVTTRTRSIRQLQNR
ncbi:hypothetical protein IMAU30132_00894 [Lactobacillus helveticus]|uniref:hypothetical protein n=1 Tax=Lactobacillus helveticus TaxID=1587 RepID=UPI001561BDEC|nr:hypothetical protein [Lactobacillus helveticus]NRO48536.1 hypothetical protein [Lactobacillus helveticus]